jgi:hypothetical protein
LGRSPAQTGNFYALGGALALAFLAAGLAASFFLACRSGFFRAYSELNFSRYNLRIDEGHLGESRLH